MSDDDDAIDAADRLRAAAETATPCAPVRDLLGTSDDLDIAYAVQAINTAHAEQSGRRISGRKIGITSHAVMQQLGVDQPDFGTLFVDMEFGDGVDIDATLVLQPRAEAEVALVLERDLDHEHHSFNDIIAATAYALPAIEIVDSRITDWDITIVDTIADNASCGLYVLGGRPTSLRDIDLARMTMTMTIDGTGVAGGTGAACLGHPLHACRWLADELSARGTPLRAGQVVMTGALGPMRPITAGNEIEAHFGGLGTVATRLV